MKTKLDEKTQGIISLFQMLTSSPVKGKSSLFSKDKITKFLGSPPFIQKAKGGGGKINYHSLDTDIAVVDLNSGLVMVKGVGRVKIVATEMKNPFSKKSSDFYILEIKESPTKTGKALYFSSDVTKKIINASFINSALDGNGGRIHYDSSDPSIASVDTYTGMVSILNTGVITITAFEDAREEFKEQRASYHLIIKDEP